jgi:hypothetical protein
LAEFFNPEEGGSTFLHNVHLYGVKIENRALQINQKYYLIMAETK